MKMYINGEWVSRNNLQEVINPFDNSIIDTVPSASVEDVSLAVDSAERGFQAMKKISSWDRYSMLMKAADLIEERKEDLGRTITLEEGKVIYDSGVVITYNKYKRNQKLGNVQAKKGDIVMIIYKIQNFMKKNILKKRNNSLWKKTYTSMLRIRIKPELCLNPKIILRNMNMRTNTI